MAKKQNTFTRQVIDAIENSGMTRYAISKVTGISQATLSRMVNGDGWIGRAAFDNLAACIGLEISIRKAKGR
jgi:transcriptional regulator with XRE-family HTH domain